MDGRGHFNTARSATYYPNLYEQIAQMSNKLSMSKSLKGPVGSGDWWNGV